MNIIAKNRKINHMDELKSRKVVEHNDLITSIAKMDKTSMKIFELAVSCIDTKNPPQNNTVYLSKKELFSFFDVNDNGKHSRFKQSVEKMQKQAFFQIKVQQNKGYKFQSIVPIPFVEWNDYNDEVSIRFDPAIMPYLIDLKSNFTQYALTDIMELNSKYSIIIYRWLCMNYNQYENYRYKNNRTQKQLDEYKNPIIHIKELRTITDTLEDYMEMSNFTKEVINKSISEITKNTHFNVTYEKIKKGRYVSEIQFHIEKKANWKDEEYKRNDAVAKLSSEQQQQLNNELFAKGVASPYTIRLLTNNLITGLDTINQETIIGLSKHVYSLYDEIVQHYGQNALSEHLGYVSDNMVDYTSSKKNIVKYLAVCAKQYLNDGVGNIVEEKKAKLDAEKKKQHKEVKKAPEWSNADYVDESSEEEKQRFAELQKNMRK